MIVSGKDIAETLYVMLQKERATFNRMTLGILVGSENPVTASYVRIKERGAARLSIDMLRRDIYPGATTDEAIAIVHELSVEADGVIPQLPLPVGIDADAVKNAIPKERDVDVLGGAAFAEFSKGAWPALPPVPAALVHILEHHQVGIAGKKVAVVGHGRLVGKPAAILFEQKGGIVKVLDKGDDIRAGTREADIIVLGTGVAGLLTSDMVQEGATVLDAGTSELGGKVVGDADPAVAEKCALFTPVPGGVGPVAIAMIYKNLFALKRTSDV